MKKKYNVTGMFCAACVSHVDKAVSKIEGVNSVNVNLMSSSMIVNFDENKVNDFDIINAVKKVGFNAFICDSRLVNKEKVNKRKINLIISLILMFVLIYVSMAKMLNFPLFDILKDNMAYNGLVQMVILIPIVIINRFFYIDGFKKLFKGSPNMNTLISVASLAAVIYGIYAIIDCFINDGASHNDLYIESAGTIVTLVSLGKYIEFRSKGKTTEAINELVNLLPSKAIRINEDGSEEEVFVEEIKIGDILLVKNACSVPVDGVIVKGSSEIDESSITGESNLVYKTIGNNVISSTVCTVGSFEMRATSTISDSTISKIIEIVEEASSSKAKISRLADKVASIFVPTVMVISFVSFLLWFIFKEDLEFALKIGISVLVISCPCALGLATPLAIMIATGKGAKNGILFKDALSIEQFNKIDTICLDKTGTITSGKLKVNSLINLNDNYNVLKIAASIEKKSSHPLALAIVSEYNSDDYYDVLDFKMIIGKGVYGFINDEKYYVGNLSFIKDEGINIINYQDIINKEIGKANTVLFVSKKEELIGIITLSDEIKESTFLAIDDFKSLGKEIVMMTGDSNKVASLVGKTLEIDRIYSEILPKDKGEIVLKLKEEGKNVAMVGDGINDAVALTNSDVGIAIGAGTDVAIASANVVLMKSDLRDVSYAMRLSEKTIKNIKLSLFWAFFYNALCIPIACGVLMPFGISLNPMIASLAMSLSSISVVLNALRLTKIK